jgi:plastocyanin
MEESAMKLVTIVLSLALSSGAAWAACADLAAAASARMDADAQCPCGAASGHRSYVQCVARVAKAAVKGGGLPKSCRTAVVKCAKQSTCGRPGFVTCCRTTAGGKTTCAVKSGAAACTPPKGGSTCVGAVPSCCDGCGGGGCASVTTTTAPGGVTPTTLGTRTRTVMVGGGGAFSFAPADLTIHVGDTVRWTWGSAGHNVVSGTSGNADGRFCSPSDTACDGAPLSGAGTTYEHTFTQPGTFPYFCAAHVSLGMRGTIEVQ